MNKNTINSNVFLEKSYQTIWEDYQYNILSPRAVTWDWVVITASNEAQAALYRMQIEERLNGGYIPKRTKYAVISDPDGKRVGSGGATLNVLKYISEHSESSDKGIFDVKILVIHSGGDSRRIPQYSVCGKLFSPVPRTLPDGRRSMLFDEIIISLSALPNRMSYGMLVVSGDALLLFNPLQIDLKLHKAAVAISVKESIEVGINHGVFLANGEKRVVKFLHKQSAEMLRNIGAADSNDCIDLDTGAVWFDKNIVNNLFSLISSNNTVDLIKFDSLVNDEVRLSFYGDFLYPLSENAVYDGYMKSAGEIPLNKKLAECRDLVWSELNKYRLSLIRLSPAKFLHFGTTRALHELVTDTVREYEFLNWSKNVLTNISTDRYSVNNSYIDLGAVIGDGCYIEDCYIGKNVKIGGNSVLSNLNIHDAEIPDNVVMHGIELTDNKYCVRVYGINDNPKNPIIESFLKCLPLYNDDKILWTADIYPVCDTAEEALDYAQIICKISNRTASVQEIQKWKDSQKTSLEESFRNADMIKTLKWKNHLENIIRAENFIDFLRSKTDIKYSESILDFNRNDISEQIGLISERAESIEFPVKFRIYQALSYILKQKNTDWQGMTYLHFEDMCYEILKHEITNVLTDHLFIKSNVCFVKDEVVTELPARVNWGGGWSDTVPYCIENGGTVINMAIKLRGGYPVKVIIKKIPEKTVRFKSIDLERESEYLRKEQLLDLSDSSDSFLIHKGALIVTGIIRNDGESLESILNGLGGGIYISSTINIPKGSGLGTSSIFACACVKALYEICGIEYDMNILYSQVLLLEQLIGTGGGWQDQIGGMTNGIKLIKSQSGIMQKITVDHIFVPLEALEELKERFVLVYSGQQRFARNILREMMNKYILSDEQTVEILYEIQRLAVLMKFELEKGDISEFSKLLSQHWELSKKLDKGSSNICIDLIFEICDDLIDGKFICGAGGGGFLQMILKKGVSKDMLRERLSQVFQDSGVSVWDCDFV